MRRRWRDFSAGPAAWITEVVNVLPKDQAEPAPSWGLLRYQDLDVTMVLSLQWTLTGSRDVEIEQRELLHRMGYGRLDCAPYDELHASLRRLTHTKVAVFRDGTPNHLVEPWQIIDETHRTEPHQTGERSLITARLSRLWEDALASAAWQAVDLNAYTHLVRVARRHGLARVLYLYLASWRDAKGGFNVPLFGIVDRFAQRRSDGRLRYPILRDERCVLRKAITHLQQHRIIEITEAIAGEDLLCARLTGRFTTVKPPAPVVEGRQLVYLAPSLWRPNEVVAVPAADVALQVQPEHHQDWDATQNDYCERTIPVLLDWLKPALPRRKVQAARDGGWEVRHLWTAIGAVLWQWQEQQSIENPAGFLQSILNDGIGDPTYRRNYQKSALANLLPISGSELMAWMLKHPLRDFPPPKPPSAKTTTSENS
jgi:hypothetical protein